MDDWVVHELSAAPRVQVVRPMPELPPALDALVEEVWRVAAARVEAGGAGRLFNGHVFSADRIEADAITGHLTEFRRIVAQMERPDLFPALGLRPLAVCGVLRCRDGVAIGRRPAAAIYQPGMWQLPPAGSVDAGAVEADGRADLARQVLAEAEEEIGLPADAIAAPRPLCVVEHPGSHVSDVGLLLETRLDAAAVLAAHRARGNAEYDPLRVVAEADLPGFVAECGPWLVPPARVFLARIGLLPQSAADLRGAAHTATA